MISFCRLEEGGVGPTTDLNSMRCTFASRLELTRINEDASQSQANVGRQKALALTLLLQLSLLVVIVDQVPEHGRRQEQELEELDSERDLEELVREAMTVAALAKRVV
jgi:hypothetical protein